MPGVSSQPKEIYNHDAFKEIEKYRANYEGICKFEYFDFLKKNGSPIRKI